MNYRKINEQPIIIPAIDYLKLNDKLQRMGKKLISFKTSKRQTFLIELEGGHILEIDKKRDFQHFINTP